MERKTHDDQEATKSLYTRQIGSKKIELQLELRNRFETKQKLDDIDTMSETIIDMIKKRVKSRQLNKPLKSRISSAIRSLVMKRREMVENGDDKQRTEFAEICKTFKKKAREDIRTNKPQAYRSGMVFYFGNSISTCTITVEYKTN